MSFTLTELPDENGWLSMNSAPKDGTYVLLCEWSGHRHIAQWCDGGYWRNRVDEPNPNWHPIGWQHLPPPMETER